MRAQALQQVRTEHEAGVKRHEEERVRLLRRPGSEKRRMLQTLEPRAVERGAPKGGGCEIAFGGFETPSLEFWNSRLGIERMTA